MKESTKGQGSPLHISPDIIVVGGGASGMMAAIAAAGEGARVLLLDHQKALGKKILSTGNGRCNFTNATLNDACYHSDNPALVGDVLRRFTNRTAITFFRTLGVYYVEKNGYYYPRSGQASAIRDALLGELNRLSVTVLTEIEILQIKKKKTFLVSTSQGDFRGKALILATGGAAAPHTGSDGSGYGFAKSFGHEILRPLPALVPLLTGERWVKRASGVRTPAALTLLVDGDVAGKEEGELQITDYGISGIPVFQLSGQAAVALENQRRVAVILDFVPEWSRQDLYIQLSDLAYGEKNWWDLLCGLINRKLAAALIQENGLSDCPLGSMGVKRWSWELERLTDALKGTRLSIVKTGRLDQAQVTTGGVSLKQVDANLESMLVEGLFFAGELLNVDAICGGYNLQWAWSSGSISGTAAARRAVSRKKEGA